MISDADQDRKVGQRGAYSLYDAVGSRPMLSFTALRSRCLQPRYRSVVWTLTWPSRNWICSSSPCGATLSRPHFAHPAFTTPQMTFGLNPPFPTRWALLMGRNIGPVLTPAAVIQLSTAVFTQPGTGTVRTWPPLPIMSAITQCSSRCWRLSTPNPATSALLRPHPRRTATHRVVPSAAQTTLVEDGKEALALCSR